MLRRAGMFVVAALLIGLGLFGLSPFEHANETESTVELTGVLEYRVRLPYIYSDGLVETSRHRVLLSNQLPRGITLADLRTSCGCLKPTVTKAIVASKDRFALEVSINLGSRQGSQAFAVFMDEKVGEQTVPLWRIVLEADIYRPLVISRSSMMLGEIESCRDASAGFSIDAFGTCIDSFPQNVRIISEQNRVRLDLGEPGPIVPVYGDLYRRTYPCRLTILPSRQFGDNSATVCAAAEVQGRQFQVKMNVNWLDVAKVNCQPERVALGHQFGKERITQAKVVLRSRGTAIPPIKRIICPSKFITCQEQAVVGQASCRLLITSLVGEVQPLQRELVEIRVEFEDDTQTSCRIPVIIQPAESEAMKHWPISSLSKGGSHD